MPGGRVGRVTHRVRPAGPEDLPALPGIEEAADALFAEHGVGPLQPGVADVDDLGRAAYVLVAGDPVVGFARLERVDGPASSSCRSTSEPTCRCRTPLERRSSGDGPQRLLEALGHRLPRLRRDTERRLGLDAAGGTRSSLRRGVGAVGRARRPRRRPSAVALGSRPARALRARLARRRRLRTGAQRPRRARGRRAPAGRRDAATAVAPVHAALDQRHPAWRGRVEVETVARSTVEAYAAGVGTVAGWSRRDHAASARARRCTSCRRRRTGSSPGPPFARRDGRSWDLRRGRSSPRSGPTWRGRPCSTTCATGRPGSRT